MRICTFLLLAGLILPGCTKMAIEMDMDITPESTIQNAISNYEIYEMPEARQIGRAVVVIHPVGGGSSDPELRLADDMSMMTAGHLFHQLIRSGGVPKLTRADDRAMRVPEGLDNPDESVACRCDQEMCHCVLVIEYTTPADPDRKPGILKFGETELASAYAQQMAEATGLTVMNPSDIGTGTPGIAVTFQGPAEGLDDSEKRKYCRQSATELCNALISFVKQDGDALAAHRQETYPDVELKADLEPVPRYPDSTPPQKVQKAARRICPDGDLTIDKAKWFVNLLVRASLSDTSMAYLEPEVVIEGDTVIVRGGTNMDELQSFCADALKVAGIKNVRNEMKLLPEESNLKDSWFGACVAPMALTFDRPSEQGYLQTQLLYGEPVLLLDYDAEKQYYLLHGSDGYWGWVREECIQPMTKDRFLDYTQGAQAVMLKDVEVAGVRIPRGASLPVTGDYMVQITVMHPNGTLSDVLPSAVRIVDQQDNAYERCENALEMVYTPYVFGALSPIGLDCSGMSRSSNVRSGIFPARDAAQQCLHGRLVGTRWFRDNIQAGDHIFFIDNSGKVFHVAIALSPTYFIHCSPPEVQISSHKAGENLYYENYDNRFFVVKRPE